MKLKKNIFLLVTFIFLGLLIIAAFNYQIDPAGLFRSSRYENGIAQILANNQNVANLSNYDERLLQKYIVANTKESRDVLVLGSSRTMQIHKGLFPNKSFFNASVSGATIEDDIAIYKIYRDSGLIPRTMIIGLDPWLLNKNNEQTRWQSLSEEYHKASVQLGLSQNKSVFTDKLNLRKYIQLISWPYLEASYKLRKERKNQANYSDYFVTSEKVLSVPVKLADGTLSYPDNIQNISPEDAKKEATKLTSSYPIYSIGNFNKLDEDSLVKFEKFMIDLQRQGIQVTLFLPPYHPAVYAKIVNDPQYKMVIEAQRFFVNYAQNRDIPLIGSYNPNECLLTDNDFYDGIHPKREAIDKIFLYNKVNQF